MESERKKAQQEATAKTRAQRGLDLLKTVQNDGGHTFNSRMANALNLNAVEETRYPSLPHHLECGRRVLPKLKGGFILPYDRTFGEYLLTNRLDIAKPALLSYMRDLATRAASIHRMIESLTHSPKNDNRELKFCMKAERHIRAIFEDARDLQEDFVPHEDSTSELGHEESEWPTMTHNDAPVPRTAAKSTADQA